MSIFELLGVVLVFLFGGGWLAFMVLKFLMPECFKL